MVVSKSLSRLLVISVLITTGVRAWVEQPVDTVKIYGSVDPTAVQEFPPLQDIMDLPVPERPVYGLYSWMGIGQDDVDNMQAVGFTHIRVGGAEWIDRPETWATNAVRQTTTLLAEADIEPMITMCGNMTRGDFTDSTGDGAWDNPDVDREFIDYYLTLIDKYLEPYGPHGTFWTEHEDAAFHPGGVNYKPVRYFEVWNEPNLHYLTGASYWNALNDSGKGDLYARLLIAAYDHIKNNASHPEWDTVRVVGIPACGVSHGGPDFVEWVHQALVAYGGHAHYYDILSWHPYTHDAGPDFEHILTWYHYSLVNDQKEIRDIMESYGNGDKPVWFTEVGWHADTGRFDPDVKEYYVTRRFQAMYVARLYLTALRLGVERVHTMFITDADNFNGGFFDLDSNYRICSWYEEAYATQNLIRLLPNPKITGAVSDGDNGYFAYTYDADAESGTDLPVTAAWNVTGPDTVNLPVEAGATYMLYDMLGDSMEADVTGDSLAVEVGPCPVYLVATGGLGISGPDGPLTGEGMAVLTANPVMGRTAVLLNVDDVSTASLEVYDGRGRLVKETAYTFTGAGNERLEWDGTDGAGNRVPGGQYFLYVTAGGCGTVLPVVVIR